MSASLYAFIDVGHIDDVPLRGSRVIASPYGYVALFKAADGMIFALRDSCPHKKGPLSQGIVHGHSVTCPLHNWVISLETGEAQGADEGCSGVLRLRIEDSRILLDVQALIAQAA